jgi:hypothetical protein
MKSFDLGSWNRVPQVLLARRFIAVVSCFLCNLQHTNRRCDRSSSEFPLLPFRSVSQLSRSRCLLHHGAAGRCNTRSDNKTRTLSFAKRKVFGLSRWHQIQLITVYVGLEARGSLVVKTLGYKPEGRGFETR